MNALRALDGTPPPVRSRRVERPLIENFIELDAWLDGRIRHARSYLDDGETAQSIGWDAQVKHRARIAAFTEVREQIAPMVEAERGDAIASYEEREDQRAKDSLRDESQESDPWARLRGLDPLEQRLMDGDR